MRNALAKATAVAERHPHAVVLAADTVVALGGDLFGKPANMEEARRMLAQLAGRVHEVYTAVCVAQDRLRRGFIDVSRVRFRPASPEAIERYLARIQPLDKAGAYAAQDDRGEMIEWIEGCPRNVAGLPLQRTASLLAKFGIFPS